MNTKVRREHDRVWIDGVTGWSVRDRQSSVHAAHETVMRAVGETVDYDYLLGVSGLAFRMQVSREGFCPSSPHPCCGFECVSGSTEALPWNARVLRCKTAETDKVREARRAVVESIDLGVPVQYGSEEDGVIVGYQREGEEWICYHPMRPDGEAFVESGWPWGIAVFTGPKDSVPSRRDLAVRALRQAATMAAARESNGYIVGFDAWAVYLTRLTELDQADDEVRKAAALGNAWIYDCLVAYRASAGRYLREVAVEFRRPASAHFCAAATFYERISREVLADAEHPAPAIAPFPWMAQGGDSWTADMRRRQRERLERALHLERGAIEEIHRALTCVEEDRPAGL